MSSVESLAQTCSPAPVGLVSWYSGDNNALDSRSRHNGTLQNGATFASGHVGQAFSLDGVNDFVKVNASPSLDVGAGNGLTFEAWVNPNMTSGDPIFEFDSSTQVGLHMFLSSSGFNNINVGGLGSSLITQDNVVPNGIFSHVALTYDKTTGIAQIFVNGVLILTSNVGVVTPQTTFDLNIGGRTLFGQDRFGGRIDELSIYNRALSASEIAAIAGAGTAGKCKPTATVAPSGQVGWWAGDGNANDISGNNNNGTPQGNVTHAVGKAGQTFRLGGNGDTSGNGDRINIGNPANLQLQDFTIETWIRRASSTIVTNSPVGGVGFGTFFAYGTNGYAFLIEQATNRLALSLVGVSGVFAPTLPIADTNFHHIAVTKIGNQVVFYVDGVATAPQTYNVTFTFTTNAAIGARGDNDPRNAFFGDIDEPSVYNRALTQAEITSIVNAGIAGKLKTATTPTGFSDAEIGGRGDAENKDVASSAVAVSPRLSVAASQFAPEVVNTTIGDVTITFPTVTTAGTTQQIPLDLALFPALPINHVSTGLTYDFATSSITSGTVGLCFNLQAFAGLTPAEFLERRILHLEGGAWTNRTHFYDFAGKRICARVPGLSPFAIVDSNLAPTAAAVSIGGRVLTADGRGISKARISLSDSDGNVRTALTNAFGYYQFDEVVAGETYTVNVQSKRYQFSNPTQVVTVLDELSNVDFTASP